jgi:hypothetical protein
MQAWPSPGTQPGRANFIPQDSHRSKKTTQMGCCAGALFDNVFERYNIMK